MRALALVVWLVPACGRSGFQPLADGVPATGLRVQLSTANGLAVVALDARFAFATMDPHALYVVSAPLPTTATFALPDASGALTAKFDAHDARGDLFTETATAQITAEQVQTISVVLGSSVAPGCLDGIADGTETDIDCGGSCSPCGLGGKCLARTDCGSNNCVGTVCEPMTAPPNWLAIADMPIGRIGAGAGLGGDGRVYVYGGAVADGGMDFAETDLYLADRDAWQVGPALGTARYRMGYATGDDGTLYALGGEINVSTLSPNVDSLATGASMWAPALALPAARDDLMAAVDSGGTLFAIGGFQGSSMTGEVDAFASGAWITRTAMPTPRMDLAGARGPDGKLYAIGGHNFPITAHYVTVEAYDTTADSWQTMPSLQTARSDLAAAAAPDGRIYAISGFTGGLPTPVVEAYRVGAPAWVSVASLSVGRDTCSAAVAADGRILVFGGKVGTTASYKTAEAYGPQLTLGAATGAVGDMVTIVGSNFAANAAVRVYFDGAPIEYGTTTSGGVLAALAIEVPAVAAGAHVVRVVDDRSDYPASASFVVQ
jgi:hypothetical protein